MKKLFFTLLFLLSFFFLFSNITQAAGCRILFSGGPCINNCSGIGGSCTNHYYYCSCDCTPSCPYYPCSQVESCQTCGPDGCGGTCKGWKCCTTDCPPTCSEKCKGTPCGKNGCNQTCYGTKCCDDSCPAACNSTYTCLTCGETPCTKQTCYGKLNCPYSYQGCTPNVGCEPMCILNPQGTFLSCKPGAGIKLDTYNQANCAKPGSPNICGNNICSIGQACVGLKCCTGSGVNEVCSGICSSICVTSSICVSHEECNVLKPSTWPCCKADSLGSSDSPYGTCGGHVEGGNYCSECRRLVGKNVCYSSEWGTRYTPVCTEPDISCGSDCTGGGGSTPTPSPTPSPTPTPTPIPPVGWWQVSDADVSTNGDLTSLIPDTCILPACNPVFGLKGTGGFPGVPSYGGSADFSLNSDSGIAAETPYNWSADTQSSFRKTYNYAFFEAQIPTDVVPTEIDSSASPSCVPGGGCTLNGGFFNSGGTATRGYVWYHFDGETLDTLTINGNVNLVGTRKVVLLIEGGDLNISGRINIGTPGSGFFMAVVGKNASGGKGNILIDDSVSRPSAAAIEGVYLAEGQISTGTGGTDSDSPLYLRGSFAAYGGMVLERNLADDSDTPAEFIEYAPEIIATFPRVFTTRRMSWKEVAP